MSSSTPSRSYIQTQKPTIIQNREPSTDSRSSKSTSTSDSRSAASYYSSNQSSRSSMSGNYHSSSRSEVYHDPTVVHKFRDWNSNNFEGTYKYSPSNKVLVINHNASSKEEDPRFHSSNATRNDFNRTQRSEKRRA